MRIILWLSVALAIGCYICEPITDPDLWWHITIGRWINANHSVPQQEHWNYFAQGQAFKAYSWSNEVLFAWVDQAFGDRGLIVLKLICATLFSLSAFYCFGRLARDWFFGGVFALVAVVACYNNFTLRPQSLVWIYLVWAVFVFHKVQQKGLSASSALLLILLSSMWANTHLSQIILLCVAVFWLLGSVSVSVLLKSILCVFMGTLITPYYGQEWLTLVSKSSHPFMFSEIAEFQAASIRQYSTAIVVLLLACAGVLLQVAPRKLEVGKWLLLVGIITAGFAVVKFLPFTILVTTALLCYYWSKFDQPYEELGNLAVAIGKLKASWKWLPKEGLAFVFICIATVNAVEVYRYPVNLEVTPVAAIDFFEKNKLPHPLLNDFGRGGYVMYRFSDKAGKLSNLVPIDGRTNVNTPEVWQAFVKTLKGLPDWNEYIDLFKPASILWKNKTPLISLLSESDNWCRVYQDASVRGYSLFVLKEKLENMQNAVDLCIDF